MTAETFIDIVKSMIDEENYKDIEIQPMQLKLDRYRDLGKAFEEAVKIKDIVNKSVDNK